jgi:hypothetical protein
VANDVVLMRLRRVPLVDNHIKAVGAKRVAEAFDRVCDEADLSAPVLAKPSTQRSDLKRRLNVEVP